jgi:heat-inducible transcriptional repressor
MRTLAVAEQEQRKHALLQAIIHQHMKTGKPVGSAFIAEEGRLDLSSATVRHVMVELEGEGYLTHPHTSAGRVPTDKAYRFYVDSLRDLQRLAQLEEERIREDYERRTREMEDLMSSTSKTLSALSHYTGFILSPAMDQALLQHVELIPLDAKRILAILVSDTGQVHHRLVVLDEGFSADSLPPLKRMLNEQLRGRPLAEARDVLLDHVEAFAQQEMTLVELARRLTRQAFSVETEGDLYLEGAGNIVSLPDFQEENKMRALVHLFDEKQLLGELIAQGLSDEKNIVEKWPGVTVRIGSENPSPDLHDLSLISSTYTVHGRTVGVLGVIGPKRMEYSRMISLVGCISKAVSGVLNKLSGGPSQ